MFSTVLAAAVLAATALMPGTSPATDQQSQTVERVTTISPFPRGLVMKDGDLYILSRGRVRGAGGVSADIDDKAGTIFRVNPELAEPAEGDVSETVRSNGEVFAAPTEPPFLLWDRSADPPWEDRRTDRPYCVLRWHEATQSFYICAFSGVDKPRGTATGRTFSKNLTDAILRYDLRTGKWYEVERHDEEHGGIYPHNDPRLDAPPHGLLNGPNNILPVGNFLYGVGKDNSVLARYDLSALVDDPEAGHAPAQVALGRDVWTENAGRIDMEGHSALAERDGWLYVGSRTSSHIIRVRLNDDGTFAIPLRAQLVARFDPWTRETNRSADVTDMSFDDEGRLYVVNARPSRVHRFTPDPKNIYDARDGGEEPWFSFADATGNQRMKSENVLVHDDMLYITSGDGYDFQYGAAGTVYRVPIVD